MLLTVSMTSLPLVCMFVKQPTVSICVLSWMPLQIKQAAYQLALLQELTVVSDPERSPVGFCRCCDCLLLLLQGCMSIPAVSSTLEAPVHV